MVVTLIRPHLIGKHQVGVGDVRACFFSHACYGFHILKEVHLRMSCLVYFLDLSLDGDVEDGADLARPEYILHFTDFSFYHQ